MIKLKDIVKEIIEPRRMNAAWTSEKDTPDEVINFTHELIARLMPEVGSLTGNFFGVEKSKKSDDWFVINKHMGTIMIYVPKDNKWYISIPGNPKIKELPKDQLKIVIKRWI